MRIRLQQGIVAAILAAGVLGVHPGSANAETLCDSSVQNCRTQLLSLIDAEQVGIDVGFWFMEDQRYVSEIINRFKAGVPVRLIIDPAGEPDVPAERDEPELRSRRRDPDDEEASAAASCT